MHRTGWGVRAGAIAWLVLGVGCIVDTDKPCRENEVEFGSDVSGCICAEGSVPNADKSGCVACGANEVVKAGACECMDGYARAGAGGACVMTQLGGACSATAPCAGDFPFCSPTGYCTKPGCTTNADCTAVSPGYWCDKTGAMPFCAKPPTGLGKTCMTSADCAGLEAARCAQGSCVVTGCATGPRCFSDYACCDYTPLAAAIGDICVPPTSLMNGNCPGTGAAPVVRP